MRFANVVKPHSSNAIPYHHINLGQYLHIGIRSTPWLRNFHEENDETYRDFASIFILDEESSVSRKMASQEVKGKI